MTYSFIQAIERGEATTYGSLLTSMRTMIRYPHNQRSAEHRLSALLCRLMQRLAGTNFNQVCAAFLNLEEIHFKQLTFVSH